MKFKLIEDSNKKSYIGYHGGVKGIKKFKTPAFFTNDETVAKKYMLKLKDKYQQLYKCKIDFDHPFIFDYNWLKEIDGNDYLENEEYINSEFGIYNEELWYAVIDIFSGYTIDYTYLIEMVKLEENFDGIVLLNSYGEFGQFDQYISFNSNNIEILGDNQ